MIDARRAAVCGVLAAGVFWIALVAFGAARADYNQLTKAVSELGAVGASHAFAWNILGFIVPGLLLAAGFMAVCSVVARVRNYPSRQPVPWRGKVKATGRAGWALLMPVIIIGGIRFGLVTDTEAAAVAVIYSLIVSLFVYRGIGLGELRRLLFESGRSTSSCVASLVRLMRRQIASTPRVER